MPNFMKHMAVTLMVGAATTAAVPAMAQSRLGVAVVDVEAAVERSNAYTVARQQMDTTYKTQLDQVKARQSTIEADLKTKRDALDGALRANGGKPSPVIQTQYEAFQKAGQEGQAEIQRIGQPVLLAQAYVNEQISAKLTDALKNAMTASKVDLVLKPEAAVSFQPSVDITAAVKAQLDTLVPSVSIVPPAGWRPGGQQQGAAPAASAPAATAPGAKPKGR